MARQRLVADAVAAETKKAKPAVASRTRAAGAPAARKAPRKAKTGNPYGSDTAAVTDSFVTAMIGINTTHTGEKQVYTAKESEQWVSVIPLPSLCLEYMLGQNGYPLSRMMHLFGVQHSGKSAMAVEILRWHLEQHGMGAISETEGKDIPDLRNSLLVHEKFQERVFFNQDPGTDLWQRRVSAWLKTYKEAADGRKADSVKGHGRKTVFNMIVDSIGAASTAEERDKIDAAGFAGRGHPVTALAISSYMKTLPEKLIGYPISLTFVNHMKPVQDAQGRQTPSTYGGKSVKFHTTYELEMSRVKSIKQARSGGIEVAFRLRKNGLGEMDRRITANLLWCNRRNSEGELQQFTYWDWHGASIALLVSLGTTCASVRQEISDIIDLRPATGRRMYSKVLGVPKDAPLRYDQFGELLYTRPELVSELRKVLGVHIRPTFEPGVDMRTQQREFMKYKLNHRVCPVQSLGAEAAELADSLHKLKEKTQMIHGKELEIREEGDE